MKSTFRSLLLSVLIAGVAGCGGGGSTTAAGSNVAVAASQAWDNYLDGNTANSYDFDLSGNSGADAITGTGTLQVSDAVQTTFNGVDAWRKTITVTGNVTSGNVAIDDTYNGYFTDTGVPLGFTNSSEYTVLENVAAVPATLRVGDSGQWYTGKIYDDAAFTNQTGTRVVTYTVEAGSNGAALVKLRQVDRDMANGLMVDLTFSFEVQTNGDVAWKEFRATSGPDFLLVYTPR